MSESMQMALIMNGRNIIKNIERGMVTQFSKVAKYHN